jgi:hypothetical protein
MTATPKKGVLIMLTHEKLIKGLSAGDQIYLESYLDQYTKASETGLVTIAPRESWRDGGPNQFSILNEGYRTNGYRKICLISFDGIDFDKTNGHLKQLAFKQTKVLPQLPTI